MHRGGFFMRYADSKRDIALPAAGASDILLVNAENPLPEDYRPKNLVNLYDQKHKHFQLAKADIEVCETVYQAMGAMFAAAQKDGVKGFIITSGYRTREEQKEIFSDTLDGTAAKPGESEHETGLAFDVTAMGDENFELTPQFEWLSKHCAEYGFIIRYPKGMEDVTGYPYEP
jgi:D-alanyl-D-alanine carboxypeptidase